MRAQIFGDLDVMIGSRRGNDIGAEVTRDLHEKASEPAGGAHDKHPIAGFELRLVAQHRVGERRMSGDDASSKEIDIVRDRMQRFGRHLYIFGIAAPSGDAEHLWRPAAALVDEARYGNTLAKLARAHA